VTDSATGRIAPRLQDTSIGTVPLWRSSTAGALLTIVVLVGASVAAAIWLSILDERRQTQGMLTGQANQAALAIRSRMIETEQLLLVEGTTYAGSLSRFQRDMTELLGANPALLRIELRRRDGMILIAIDPPPPRPVLLSSMRQVLPPEAAAAFQTAARQNRFSYSAPYFATLGAAGFDLVELVVPTSDPDGPLIVATYAPQRILEHFLPADLAPGPLYSLVDVDGTVAARQVPLGQARGELHGIAPLARTGTTLQVRVDGLDDGPRIIPNTLTGLVAATSVGLGLAMFFLVRDIRQRERVERALREQVLFRRAVEDAMLHALMVFDLEDRVIQVNDALCAITGFARDELVGTRSPMPYDTTESARDYRAYLERIRAASRVQGAAESERARGFETVYRRKNSDLCPVLVVETPVVDPDAHPIGRMRVAVDLSEQRRAEELARRQQEILQSRSRLATLGEMASTLSHELNQPLAAITSYAAACENLVGAEPARPEPVRQALRGIRSQAERAGQVIRSVQSFLRRRAIDRSDVDVGALVRGVEPLLKLQATRTGSRIVVDVPPGTLAWADRIMLEQVLLNLSRNGFEAMSDMPSDDRVLELTARPRHDDERGERVQISVIDRGRGVPPEVVPQLFNAFFTTKSEGMGLGLSLCRTVIEQHGGQLQYRERPAGGSIFTFDLPRRDPSAAARSDPAPSRAEP
jgi:two-component system, LuxR family, sensor histidine kinase DctS